METIRTRIKFCGMTRPGDAIRAAELGVDAIGLVFHEASPRHVTPERAREIIAALPAFVTTAGLFVNAEPGTVRRILEAVPLDVLQFHGDEDRAYCRSFDRPYIKALSVREGMDVAAAIDSFDGASAVLLDAWNKDLAGGTGERFDWRLIPDGLRGSRLILAGGLDAGNVARAIREVRPWAVDVSSGVEADRGVKSPERMRQFVTAVTNV